MDKHGIMKMTDSPLKDSVQLEDGACDVDVNDVVVVVSPKRGIAEYLSFLARSVVNHSHFRVRGPSEGYRCKMTYSLYPSYSTSPLGMPDVNGLSDVVHGFVSTSARCPPGSRWIYERHPRFFFEVCAKVSRNKEYMVKLVLFNERCAASGKESDLFTEWRACGEDSRFLAYIDEHFHGHVAVVIAHVGLEKKADKEDAYVPLRSCVVNHESRDDEVSLSGTCASEPSVSIVELTPNGVPFLLSADSFCEVNHRMEDEMYVETLRMLRLPPPPPPPPLHSQSGGCAARVVLDPPRRVFISGRDVNSVVKTYDMYYAQVSAVTTCPRVYEDVQRNGLGDVCAFSRKDEIWKHLRHLRTGEWPDEGVKSISSSGLKVPHQAGDATTLPTQVLITAGRHGLHPSTCFEFVQFALHGADSQDAATGRLEDVVYVSCNVESLSRDLFILKEGFFVAGVRTFDFFPGTDYVMTMLHLRPLALQVEPGHHRGLLVLPVGPPGIGKSTCGRFWADTLRSELLEDSEGGGVEGVPEEQQEDGECPVVGNPTRRGRTATPPSGQSKDELDAQFVPVKKKQRVSTPQSKRSKGNNQKKSATNVAKKPFIPRHFATFRPSWVAHCVERDDVFRRCKNDGMSLKLAKQRTHETLLNALNLTFREESTPSLPFSASNVPPRVVLYLDSTNGSRDGRELYHRTWRGFLSLDARLALPPSDTEAAATALLNRTRERQNHPSFPAEEQAQREKIATIMTALNEAEAEEMEEARSSTSKTDCSIEGRVASICVQNGRNTQQTCERMVLHIVAALVFSPGVLSLNSEGKDSNPACTALWKDSWPIVNDAIALMEASPQE